MRGPNQGPGLIQHKNWGFGLFPESIICSCGTDPSEFFSCSGPNPRTPLFVKYWDKITEPQILNIDIGIRWLEYHHLWDHSLNNCLQLLLKHYIVIISWSPKAVILESAFCNQSTGISILQSVPRIQGIVI